MRSGYVAAYVAAQNVELICWRTTQLRNMFKNSYLLEKKIKIVVSADSSESPLSDEVCNLAQL